MLFSQKFVNIKEAVNVMSINYPNKKVMTQTSHEVSYGQRGMTFEKELNESNKYYQAHNKALIHKKPTPIQIVKVDYPSRQKAVIREAYFQSPSTTDYNGIYRGKYIDFEAKETTSKTAFPIQNIHEHQYAHIMQVIGLGGIAFILVKFSALNKVYLLDGNIVVEAYEKYLKDGPKSFSIKFFVEKGHEITERCLFSIDYLKIIDKVYFSD
ncbi:MAG: Recombination protein RecU [Haloplasmataceae bacterium]|jgi:recombination protein U|nr:Recombination protein RecU [Haloplasmataceae bacterium]